MREEARMGGREIRGRMTGEDRKVWKRWDRNIRHGGRYREKRKERGKERRRREKEMEERKKNRE